MRKNPDEDLVDACRSAMAARAACETALEADADADNFRIRALIDHERTAFNYAVATPASAAAGLAAKAALLVGWEMEKEGLVLAISIVKDAASIARALIDAPERSSVACGDS